MAGFVAAAGVNDEGVAVCVNALPQLPAASTGVPVAAGVRGVLTRSTRADAAAFVRSTAHASGQHYTIGDSTGIDAIEAGAAGTVDLDIGPLGIAHTNHVLAADTSDGGPASVTETALSFSEVRLAFVAEQIAKGGVDAERALEILGDRTTPICRVPDERQRGVSAWTLVFALGPPVRAFAADGPGRPVRVFEPVSA
jgi:hypothetical protein